MSVKSAILAQKQNLAKEWVEGVEFAADYIGKRGARAKEWLLENGAPNERDHYWSYTKPSLLNSEVGQDQFTNYDFDGLKISPTTHHNGNDLEIKPLADASHSFYGDLVANAHGRGARPTAERILLGSEGLYIHVKGDAGTLVLDQDEWPNRYYLGIKINEGAKLTIIEKGSQSERIESLLEVIVDAGAQFHHLRLAPPNNSVRHGHLFAELGEGSELRSFTLSGENKLNRFESIVDLKGDNAHVSISGADLLLGKGHQDDTVYITHDALNCTSRQVYKRVVDAGATSVFQGKILVKEGAQKTDGYQISQGLILDDGAEVLSKPELEIYADDVACSHGSTTSGLDANSLFYLRSRGIGMGMARQLLVRAFVEEALEEIQDEDLADRIGKIAEEWIFSEAL